MTFDQYQKLKTIRRAMERRGTPIEQAAVTDGIGMHVFDPVTEEWLCQAQDFLDGRRAEFPAAAASQ